jgi:hypothetical protein
MAELGHMHHGWPEQKVPVETAMQSESSVQDWSKLDGAIVMHAPASTEQTPVLIADVQTPLLQLTAWQFWVHGSQLSSGQ